jgi:FMN-dependent NADH-azoreductase
MAKILHIQASPRGSESFSVRAAEALLTEWSSAREGNSIETLDLFSAELPDFAAPAARAKYAVMAGGKPADEAQRAWKEVIEVVDHFKSADAYVISSPMWNFGIPYRLKHYVDLLVQPGLTFGYSPDSGYEGLITGKPAVLILARGSAYSPGTPGEAFDFQKPYLQAVLGLIGFTAVEEVLIEPTVRDGPATAEQALREAVERARMLGREMAANIPGRLPHREDPSHT